jgi:hypothetical protein
VAGDVGYEVLASDTHQVISDVFDIVLDGVGAVPETDVLVDGGQTHRDSAGAIHRCLVHHSDFQAVLLGPVGSLDSRAAGGHTATEDQQVGFDNNFFKLSHLNLPSTFSA